MRGAKFSAIALIWLGGVWGPAAPAGAAQEPVYQVELLVFRNADTSRNTPEAPPAPAPEADNRLEQLLARLEIAQRVEDDAPPAEAPATVAWEPVIAGTRILSRDAATLRRLSAYDLLAHLAWTQPATMADEPVSIPLVELGLNPDEAHGSVTFYKKRYLHLGIDLKLGAAPLAPDFGSGLTRIGAASAPAPPAISDSRRIRLDQAIYFDQPEIGVVAIVNRVDQSDE